MMSLADKRLSKNPPSPFHGRVSAFSEGIVKHQLLDRGWGRPLKIKKAHCTALPEWSVHRVERIKWISQQIGPDLMNSQSHQKWVCKSVKSFVGFYYRWSDGQVVTLAGPIRQNSPRFCRQGQISFRPCFPFIVGVSKHPSSFHFSTFILFLLELGIRSLFQSFFDQTRSVLWNPIKIWNLFRCVVQWIVRHHLKHW